MNSRIRFLLPLLPVLLLFALTATSAPDSPKWKAGAASAKITPEQPMWMAGYAARTKPSDGVELDLYAKALVLTDEAGASFALVTLDLIGVPRELRLNVAKRAKEEHGITPENLTINASHTHSGPELRTTKSDGTDDAEKRSAEATAYTAALEDTIVKLIGEALQQAQPAHLDYSSARCGFSMNRRTPDGKGGWSNFPNPDGPVDQTVPVLKAEDAEGKSIAVVFGYACHCTTLGHQKFSGDYAGYAQTEIEKAHPGTVAMFMNGCSGDQNPYPRRTTELAMTHGKSLATAVETALTTHMKRLSGSIRSGYREIPLRFDTLPTTEELKGRSESSDKWASAHALRMLGRIKKEGSLPETYPYPVQVIRLGTDLTWVTLGGEVVVDYSLRLKQELKDPIVWVSGYSNDVMGYIPSLRVWKEGGYEGGGAMVYSSLPNRWNDQVEADIIDTVFSIRAALE
jgi:neutral ceramidase